MLYNKVMLDLNQYRYIWSVVGFHNYNKQMDYLAANQRQMVTLKKVKLKQFLMDWEVGALLQQRIHDYCNGPIS